MAELCRIPYKPKALSLIWKGLWMGACAYGIAQVSSIFYVSKIAFLFWFLAIFGGISLFSGIFGGIRAMALPRFVILEDDAVVIPHGFLQLFQTRIEYAEIRGCAERSNKGLTWLEIRTSSEVRSINRMFLPDEKSYGQLRELIQLKTGHPE